MMIVLLLWGFLGWWVVAAVTGRVSVFEIRTVVATTVLRLIWVGRTVRRRSAPDELALVRNISCRVEDVSWLWRNRKFLHLRDLLVVDVYIDAVQPDPHGRNQWITSKLHHWRADGSFWRRSWGESP